MQAWSHTFVSSSAVVNYDRYSAGCLPISHHSNFRFVSLTFKLAGCWGTVAAAIAAGIAAAWRHLLLFVDYTLGTVEQRSLIKYEKEPSCCVVSRYLNSLSLGTRLIFKFLTVKLFLCLDRRSLSVNHDYWNPANLCLFKVECVQMAARAFV